MQEMSDGQLLEHWRLGDQRSGQLLLRRHYRSVLRYFELNASHVAEDLTQRTLLACVENATKIIDPQAFRAYVMGIARRQLAMHLRRAKPIDSFDEHDRDRGPARTGVSTLVARNAEQFLALRALASLPRRPQLLLVLFYWEQMQSDEIGAARGVPGSTIRTRLVRARELLRERMEAFACEGTYVSMEDERIQALLSSVLDVGVT